MKRAYLRLSGELVKQLLVLPGDVRVMDARYDFSRDELVLGLVGQDLPPRADVLEGFQPIVLDYHEFQSPIPPIWITDRKSPFFHLYPDFRCLKAVCGYVPPDGVPLYDSREKPTSACPVCAGQEPKPVWAREWEAGSVWHACIDPDGIWPVCGYRINPEKWHYKSNQTPSLTCPECQKRLQEGKGGP